MNFNRIPVGIVWLKRDLRLRDHAALSHALKKHKKIILVYFSEFSLQAESHFSDRHLNFIKQSLEDLNQQLKVLNTSIFALEGEVVPLLEALNNFFLIEGLYSHYETGINLTFQRDQKVAAWCDQEGIAWKEFPQQGVFRGLKNRKK